MKNLIILGSGRSGTSAVAGLFRSEPGIFYGYDILEPTGDNPTGYYECEVVNTLNNILLRQMTGVSLLDVLPSWLLPSVERRFSWVHRDTRSLWLARPKRQLRWRLSYDIAHLMHRMARHQPFCLKDPRFTFTLPLWQPYLPDGVRFVVVFRHPVATVASIMRDAVALYGNRPLPVDRAWTIDHWKMVYENILQQRLEDPDKWMFIDFEQVKSGLSLDALGAFSDSTLDKTHLRVSASRTVELPRDMGSECEQLYSTLCRQAELDRTRFAH